ncbi:hypothetical protein [Kribbella kalugense]|uniref:DUF5666 domain-containing protein n=1 Tax=Kribbella kalugense TaxID=2512221 RepID=A0A4R7ZZA6_9ACTN|nr:hypothetical protein [Kribbella kalugense]TDW22298.1 hypothetical protein EV650_1135 [Kribbella kalugense]
MSNQTPDDFTQIGSDEEVDAALKPKKTLNLPLATAILAGIVVLAIGLAGGAGLHAAFASDSTSNQPQASGRGAGGYGGFRGQNGGGTGQGGQGTGQFPGGAGTIGTVVSATSTELVVKTQTGNVTVKLTGDTTYEITKQGTSADLKAGEQVVVTGQTANGTVTANSVRQGTLGGGFRNPNATPSSR